MRLPRACLAALLAGLAGGCGGPPPAATPYVERAAQLGVDAIHVNGADGRLYFAEIFAPGVGLFDMDGDGDLDLYLPQGHGLDPAAPANDSPPRDRLYRNDLRETGRLGFTDVTDASGIVGDEYGMGVAAGDYDADGDIDLYVTALGPDRLLRNEGDGTFSDVTEASGTGDERWNSGAAFADLDGDGRLDLFVLGYVAWSAASDRPCRTPAGAPEYCGPQSYTPLSDRLFRNLGDGRFEDVSAASGVAALAGAGLGLVVADFDGDGRTDVYVANDGMANRLWINLGDGRFEDRAPLAGCAVNIDGEPEASMGVDAGDVDGDGDLDLFMTHLDDETNTLYLNDGTGWFHDATADAGLAAPSRALTGFGTAWLDQDGDGDLDLAVANGAVKRLAAQVRAGDPLPLRQPDQLFRNLGRGRFEEIDAGPAFAEPTVGRGMAVGDLDDDGDPDLVVATNGGAVRILLDENERPGGWIGLRLTDAAGRIDDLGASVDIELDDDRVLRRRPRVAGSYLSSNDPRVLTGLGGAVVRELRVRWSDGAVERWSEPGTNRYHTLRRGEGQPVR